MSRPVRSTRGVRTTPTEEQNHRDLQIYSRIFGNLDDGDDDSQVQKKDIFAEFSKEQKAVVNTGTFPYSRGAHYFYYLEEYPRLGSTSYVEDIHPFGTYHDDQNQLVYKCQGLINRKYFGLPTRQKGQKSRSKNVCHEYLFKNEDKKWRLDQQLYQLKYIWNHPDILKGATTKRFPYVRRDVELIPLYEGELPFQDKLVLVKRKMDFLQQRKGKLFQELQVQDQLFYQSSLNQAFFNKKEEQEAAFSIQNIIMEAICMSELNGEISADIAQPLGQYSKLIVLFSVFTTLGKAMPTYQKQFQEYVAKGRPQGKIPPSFIMSFDNRNNLSWVGQALAIRILQANGDTAFYALKNIWRKLFGQELTFKQEYVQLEKDQYAEAIRTIIRSHHLAKPEHEHKSPKLPAALQNKEFYFQQQQALRLSAKDYIILYMIYYLYERVDILNLDYRLVGAELFEKYQYKLCQKLVQVDVANFVLTLKKCSDLVVEDIPDTQIPIEISVENIKDYDILMVWIKGKETGQYQSGQEQEEQSQGDQLDDGEHGDQDQDEEDSEQQESGEDGSDGSETPGEHPTKRIRTTPE